MHLQVRAFTPEGASVCLLTAMNKTLPGSLVSYIYSVN